MAKRVAGSNGRTSSGTARKTSGTKAKGAASKSRGVASKRRSATARTGSRSTAAKRTVADHSSAGRGRTAGSAQSQSRERRQAVRRVQRASGPDAGGAAHPLFDRDDIRRWAEERGAVPTCVRGVGRRGDVGIIRLEFPRFGEEPKLQPINWDEWFEKFEQSGLALVVQDETGSGEKSNFNKLVKRTTVKAKARPMARSAH